MKFHESAYIELKSSVNKMLAKEIIAFANANGGKIYIGVEDDGTVCGLENIDSDMELVSNILVDAISPSILLFTKVDRMVIDEKEIIEIEVQSGDGKPYYLKQKGMKPSGVYVRVGSTSVPTTDKEIRKMLIGIDNITYEMQRSLYQDLTFKVAKKEFEFRNITFDIPQMKTLGLIDLNSQYTNLALLLSDQCPHIIKLAVFDGDSKISFKSRQVFEGSIFRQMNEAYAYLQRYNNLRSTFEGLYRIDQQDYNEVTLREALLNSIVHRNYSDRGSNFINIYDSSIEFLSTGGLVDDMTLEDALEGISKPRNKRLSDIFYRLELIEAYGTGIVRILDIYRSHYKQPEFKATPNAFIVRLPNFNTSSEHVSETQGVYRSDEKVTINILDIEEVKEDIVSYISDHGFITRKDLQTRYNFSQSKCGKVLKEMVDQNILVSVGKGKNTYYKLL